MPEAGAQPLPVRGARGRGSPSRRGDIPHRPRTPNPPPTAAHPTDALVPPPPPGPRASRSRHSPRLARGVSAWALAGGVAPRHWPADRSLAVASVYKDAPPAPLRLVHPSPTAIRRSPTAPSRCAREAAAPAPPPAPGVSF
ncbi:hypothetical protein PAHAL_6G208000 [Panicum hallii]|uniref:Uncharacterized protein n=1 Tax=Panicum hallii TaxID=206008 RepID=A0A2T8IGY7_9POAL|nr:hypothetical protein PAHAL_6G208000 [Panicum hallii]